jgi:glycerophosphoryl diester phosphodiesterase
VTRPRTGYPFLDWGLDQPGSVLAFAHRGGAFHPEIEGLENSLAAFEHAVALGYEYLETDVHATKDGELLAFHDAVLDRVTEHRGAIADLSYADVSRSLIGGREEIPRMSALLEHFPQARFNVDIKSDAAVQPLAELLAETNAYDRICVGSFSGRRMRSFRSLVGGRVATAATPGEVAAIRLLPPARWLDALAACRAAALQVPHHWGPLRVVTPALVERAHRLGMHVHVWTVDDPARMCALLDLGVDGLMTDRTDLLREVLVARGQWRGTQA